MLMFVSLLVAACGGGVTGNAKNFLVLDDQVVVNLNEVTLTRASIEQTVCVVIFDASVLFDDTKGHTLIGEKTLEAGEYFDEKVSLIRESKNNESMFAELREGACGSDENSTMTSNVVIAQGSVSAVRFIITYSTKPFIETRNQLISAVSGNSVFVHKVVADRSSWLVVHRFDEGSDANLGEILGYQLVKEGHSSQVQVSLKTVLVENTESMVVLYENTDQLSLENEDFEPLEDGLIPNVISPIMTIITR